MNAPQQISDSIDELQPAHREVRPRNLYKAPDMNTKKCEHSNGSFFASNKSSKAALFHSHCLLKVGRRKQKKFHSFAMTSFPLFINLRLSFSFTFFLSLAFVRKKAIFDDWTNNAGHWLTQLFEENRKRPKKMQRWLMSHWIAFRGLLLFSLSGCRVWQRSQQTLQIQSRKNFSQHIIFFLLDLRAQPPTKKKVGSPVSGGKRDREEERKQLFGKNNEYTHLAIFFRREVA